MSKTKITKKDLASVLDLLIERLNNRTTKRKGKPYANRHEALGKITEEQFELTAAIKKEDKNAIREEALDVAESCMYLIASTIAKRKAKKKKAKKVKKVEI